MTLPIHKVLSLLLLLNKTCKNLSLKKFLKDLIVAKHSEDWAKKDLTMTEYYAPEPNLKRVNLRMLVVEILGDQFSLAQD